MAPAPPSNDIFISYCHKDDQPFGDGAKRWVSDFHRDLRTRTENYLGRAVTAWRDAKLSGADVFSDEIEGQLRASAVLVSVLSPSYLAADWCRLEVDVFDAGVSGGVRVGTGLRVVKVLKTPVPRADLQRVLPLMDTVLGYEFYHIDRESEVVRELFLHPDPEIRRAYWTRIDDVAQAVAHLVTGMGTTTPSPESRVVTPATAADVLYLAETTSDLQAERDRLRREFEDRGYRVLPDRPLPTEVEGFVTTVRSDLEHAKLSIHPLGVRYGFVPEGSERSAIALQTDLAADMHRSGFSRIMWIPPGTDPRDDRQARYLDGLRRQPGRQNGYELVEASLEQVKTLILDRLQGPTPVASIPVEHASAPTRIYLCCDRRDLASVPPLADCLQSAGYEVTLPLSEGDPAQLDQDHQDTLRLCDAVVLFWGAADEFWLRTKQRDLVRARGLGRGRPFRAIGVYVTAPETPAKRSLRSAEAVIIQRFEPFAPDAIEPLRAAIERRQ